jgi:hypothetical protein
VTLPRYGMVGAFMDPHPEGEYLRHDETVQSVVDEWDDTCCGRRNGVECESCRTFERVLFLLGADMDNLPTPTKETS